MNIQIFSIFVLALLVTATCGQYSAHGVHSYWNNWICYKGWEFT